MISSPNITCNSKTQYVLSLDGGGIRGIVSAMILEELEKRVGKTINQTFDLVGGTSTGSLIAGACLVPDPKNPSEPHYTAGQVSELMKTRCHEVFHRSLWHEISSADGLFCPKYDSTGVRNLVKSLSDDKLSNLLTEAWFPACEVNNDPFYFTRKQARQNPYWNNLMLSQVYSCTTAAPYYFSAEELPIENKVYVLEDGGLFANCPASNVINEAKELFGCGDNQVCISIGTGYQVYTSNEAKNLNQGGIEVVLPTINRSILAKQKDSLKQAQQMLGDRLLRFDLEIENDSLDDCSSKNINSLIDKTKGYIDKNYERFENAARILSRRRMPDERPGAPQEAYS